MGAPFKNTQQIKICIIAGGGDCPPMNTALRSFVRQLPKHIEPWTIKNAWHGITDISRFIRMSESDFTGLQGPYLGGTVYGTVRNKALKNDISAQMQAASHLQEHNFTSLVVIGGDGSFKAAEAIRSHNIWTGDCYYMPATIDNDIAGTHESLGSDSIIANTLSMIESLRSGIVSCPNRVFVFGTMSAGCLYLPLAIARASQADALVLKAALVESDISQLTELFNVKKNGLVIVGEQNHADADLMLACHTIATQLKACGINARANVPYHLQRHCAPSTYDDKLAEQMTTAIVNAINRQAHSGCVICVLSDGSLCFKPLLDCKGQKGFDVFSKHYNSLKENTLIIDG